MDTRDTKLQNLLFLLSAAPLGMGCIITSDDDGGDSGNNTTTGSPATGDTGTTTDAPGESTAAATDDRGETTEAPADTTDAPADTTAADDTTDGGVEVPPLCATYGDVIEGCFAGYGEIAAEQCAYFLADYTASYGDACAAAFEEYITCLSGLTCKELEVKDMVPAACEDEDAAIETECVKGE